MSVRGDAAEALMARVEQAFSLAPRPEHFTNHTHCDECREHDETMRARDRTSLTLEDIGDTWSPFSFLTPEGYRYYMPALIRLALSEPEGAFLNTLVSDLGTPISRESPPPSLRRTALFSRRETNAVLEFLRFVRAERSKRMEDHGAFLKVLDRALRNWEHFLSRFAPG